MKKFIVFDFSDTLARMRPATLLISESKLARLSQYYKLAIITGAKRAETLNILNKLNITRYFDQVLTKDDTNFRKPNPKLFDLIAAKEDIVLYTGDSKKDWQMAQSAKINFLNIKDLKKMKSSGIINSLNSPVLTQVEAGVFLAIDGGNLYRKLKELNLLKLSEFDYYGFAAKLSRNCKFKCTYYVGQIREEPNNPKSNELKRNQDRLFANLRRQGVEVKTGYILKSGDKYQEKGVDVQLAVDICMEAVRDEYTRLVLVSSDTDLIPAVKEAKTLGKEVEYVGFDSKPSFALMRFSDSRTLLRKEDLLPFVKKQL